MSDRQEQLQAEAPEFEFGRIVKSVMEMWPTDKLIKKLVEMHRAHPEESDESLALFGATATLIELRCMAGEYGA